MIFKKRSHKILSILFSVSVIISGFLIFFKAYPDNFISSSLDAILYSFLTSTSWIRNKFDGFISEIKVAREARKEINDLKNQISDLQSQLADYHNIKRENIQLSEFCNVKKEHPEMEFTSASVIGKLSNENIFIDVGKNDGINKNDAVITKEGFIGRVSRVGPFSSNVTTILSPDIKIGVIDSNTGNVGMLSGVSEFSDKNLTRMTLIKYKDSVKESDILTTSGFSGLYPKNLNIGTVEFIQHDANSASYFAVVKPFCNIEDTKNVYVITNFASKNLIDY